MTDDSTLRSAAPDGVQVGRVGKIVFGEEAGSYIKVEDDAANTGGYLILTATDPDMREGFDNWVENRDALAKYFSDAGWVIEWL